MNIPEGFIIESEPESMKSPSIPDGFVIDDEAVVQEPVAPAPAPLPTTSITYADKSTYDGIVADIPRKNAINAQAEASAQSLLQEKTQELDAATQELQSEFSWLDTPFKSEDKDTQNIIKDMVKIWKDAKLPTVDKLAKLRKLREGSKRVFAARQQGAELDTKASEIGLQEKALRMPYLAAKGTASGLTMGASDIAFNKAEEALGGRVEAQTLGESALSTIGQLAGGVATGRIAAGGIGKSLAQAGAKGLTQFVGTRLATNIGMTTARQITGMIAGDIKPADAAGNFAQNVGAGIVSMLPELVVPAGVGNAISQVATDLAYDFATDLWRGRVDASTGESLQKWFIETELPQLVNSMIFAGMDLADPDFKAKQAALKQEIKAHWQAGIKGKTPPPLPIVDAETGAVLERQPDGTMQPAKSSELAPLTPEERAALPPEPSTGLPPLKEKPITPPPAPNQTPDKAATPLTKEGEAGVVQKETLTTGEKPPELMTELQFDNSGRASVDGAEVTITRFGAKEAHVKELRSWKQGAGVTMMRQLIKWADANGVRLFGEARPMTPSEGVSGLDPERLLSFYKRFGFKPYGLDSVARDPVNATQQAATREGDRYVFKGDAPAPKDAEPALTAKEQAEIEAEAQADLTPELPPVKAQTPTRVTVPEAKREVPIIPPPREPTNASPASPEAETKLSQHAVKFADYVEKKGDKGLADQIRENPANLYKVVNDKQVTDYIGSLKDDEVRSLAMDTPKEDIENRPLALVAAIEYENRQFDKRLKFMEQRDLAEKNKDTVKADAMQREIDSLDGSIEQAVTAAKNISSSAGWILRSAQIAAQATPRTQLAKFVSMLDKQGLKIKKPTQEKIVMQLNKASTALKNLEAYEEKFRKGGVPMAEGMAQLKKLRNDLFDAANKTRNTMHAASGGKLSDLYMSDVQGSLLTLISLIRNPAYNISYKTSVYGPQQIGATLVDALRSKITGKERLLTFRNPAQAAKQNVAGLKQGLKDATRTMLHGYESVDNVKPLGEKTAKVSPFLAMKELFNYYRDPNNSDLPVVKDKKTGKSRVPTKVIAYKIAEAASSLPQGLLRMLPFGDRPFATTEKNRILTNIGKTELNLEGEALDRFVAAPPRWADSAAEMEAANISFQQDSKLTENWMKITGQAEKIPLVGPAVKVGIRAGLSPFMKTLVNYTKTTMELTNPYVPAIRSIWHASQAARLSKENHVKNTDKVKTHTVESERALALAGVGVALGALGNYIAETGAWTSNDPRGSDKERAKSYAQMGRGYINWTGLFRGLRGGDAGFRDGDLVMHTGWLGPVGTSISARQNMKIAKMDNEPTPLESEVGMPAMEGNNLSASIGAAMELPIAQNMTSLLDQLKQRRFDFLEDMTSTLTSPGHMNAFKHFNKIFYKDIRQRKGVGQDLELVKDRLAREFMLATYPVQEWARAEGEMDKLLPRIHSPYTGEPVPATPRDKSLALWMVDPTDTQFKKLHPVETFLLELQKAAEKADPANDIYPTVPSVRSVFTDKAGKKYKVAGNKDTLQKLNKIHGEEIAKQVALFQENVDKDATIQEKVKYWKKYVKRAKDNYKKRVLIQFPSMKSIEDEGDDDNEE